MQIKNQTALIRETDCIGCTKCIRVCPVDAILGAKKQMHTVIYNECTGCELCINSCPVNCITLVSTIKPNEIRHQIKKREAQERFDFRNFRLQRDSLDKIKRQETIQIRKIAIQEALLRIEAKRKYEYKKNK